MSRTNRRERWRSAVLRHRAPQMTGEVRALLLVLVERMDRNAVVSWPRKDLAETFDVPQSRITERIQRAQELGLLVTVEKGCPGRTAVYQGTIPPPVDKSGWRGSVPTDHEGVRRTVPVTTGTSRRTSESPEHGPSRRVAKGSNGVEAEDHVQFACASRLIHQQEEEIDPRRQRPSPYLVVHNSGQMAEKNRQLRELELLITTEMTA